MATVPKNSPSEDARSLLECPVCVSTFRNPKSLRCGHSVCFECCQQLRTALHVVCPVCRTRTPVPAEGLPTNFALQDLIEHHVTQQGDKKYTCSACGRRYLIDESWICSLCNSSLICANCAIKDHRGHDLQMVSEIISRRREELAEWRQRMEGTVREVDARRRQIDANLVRIEQRSIQLNAALRTKLEPRFTEAIQELNAERDQLYKAINEVDVSDIIASTTTDGETAAQAHSQFENQLNEVPAKLESLKTKQEQILADQRLALEVVQNCHEVLRQMLSTTPKKTAGQQQQVLDGAGVSTSTASTPSRSSLGGLGIAARAQACRRGPIFPHPLSDRRSLRPSFFSSDSHIDGVSLSAVLAEAGHLTGDEDTMGECEVTLFPSLAAGTSIRESGDNVETERNAIAGDEMMVDAEPIQGAGNATSTQPHLTQVNLSMIAQPSPSEHRERVANTGVFARAFRPGRAELNISSDEEMDVRNLQGIGPGSAPRRRGGCSFPLHGHIGKARGRPIFSQGSPSTVGGSHSREDPSHALGSPRGAPADSPVSVGSRQERQRERRTAIRPRNNAEDAAGQSGVGAGASINIEGRIRFVASDSSEDDVTDAIVFRTFLPSGRSNDKAKH